MGKVLIYAVWVILIIVVIVDRFFFRFPDVIYVSFMIIGMLIGVIGYFIEKRK